MARRQDRRRRASAGGATGALPALPTLTDLPDLADLAPSAAQREAYAACAARLGEGLPEGRRDLCLGCVVRLDRGYPAVATEGSIFRAEFATQLTKGDRNRVAVGDWVCARLPEGHDRGLIMEVLPRESDIARWRGGGRGERQTLAANVGLVLVACALGEWGLSLDRVARSFVVARDCGASAAVVLTKADRASGDELASAVGALREVLGGDVTVVATSAGGSGADSGRLEALSERLGVPFGEAAVRGLVPPGRVAIVLGESGAGKSTLLNALLGRRVLDTGTVRATDDAGRHTTVARRMVRIPGGGVIVDEPGLRSLPLLGHERGLALTFPEVVSASADCRFRDCSHSHEPGCAVRALVGEGALPQARLDAYLALAAEMRQSAGLIDPDVGI